MGQNWVNDLIAAGIGFVLALLLVALVGPPGETPEQQCVPAAQATAHPPPATMNW